MKNWTSSGRDRWGSRAGLGGPWAGSAGPLHTVESLIVEASGRATLLALRGGGCADAPAAPLSSLDLRPWAALSARWPGTGRGRPRHVASRREFAENPGFLASPDLKKKWKGQHKPRRSHRLNVAPVFLSSLPRFTRPETRTPTKL